ncbi:MAG: GAF domain-containing sensor histidine kinase [Elusimicrobiaceae bacterium]|nr:GAF domain-containing sensor histidine kinase [Elusimicrobiaceae bacterium]
MPREDYSSLEMLVTVSRLLSSKLELGDLLNYIMKLASRVVGAERASLFLIDPVTGELYFDVAMGLDPEIQKIRLKPGQGIAGRTVLEEKSIIINDVELDASHLRAIDEKSGFVTRSILSCPMIVKGRIIGVVQALNHLEGPFTDYELRSFEAFASQAAIAIENARLFASVKEEKRLLGLLFERTRDGVLMLDDARNIKLANESARLYLQNTSAGISEALAGMRLTPPLETLLQSEQPATDFEGERTEPKKLFIEGNVIPLASETAHGMPARREGWILLFRDVTSRKTEERLARDFLSLISHKLRTPLTVINGYLEILAEEVGSPDAIKAVNVITRQGLKLNALIDEVVSFAAVEGLDPAKLEKKNVDLGRLTAEAVRRATEQYEVDAILPRQAGDMPAPQVGKKSIFTCLQPGVIIAGDDGLLRSAIAELVANGLKFNPGGTKLVDVAVGEAGGFGVVTVSDNGPGIAPEDTQNVFRKFYQAENSFTGQVEGWGLGLAFVKRIVEAHGGTAELESAPGKGAELRLKFRLPGKTA